MLDGKSAIFEYNFPKPVVFRALKQAVSSMREVNVTAVDDLTSCLELKTGVSVFSWGEVILISVLSQDKGSSSVEISSAAKTVLGSAHRRNRANISKVMVQTSKVLNANGNVWKKEMVDANEEERHSSPSMADEIIKLASLKDAGVLSAEEFAEQKTRLLKTSSL